jgi:organic hydroperoxide reductase OsmC/OhrA
MTKTHQYSLTVRWTGNKGYGTSSYRAYARSHIVQIDNKVDILGSSDPGFLGDPKKHNPEELFVASISTCHMLWFLHLCAEAGVVVTDYYDHAVGTMLETEDGGGYFSEVSLHPTVTVSDQSMVDKANSIHYRANALCFIANSVKFPVHHHPTALVETPKSAF